MEAIEALIVALAGAGTVGAGGGILYTRRQVVQRNGGSSVRDQLDRIEMVTSDNSQHLAAMEAHWSDLDKRIDRLENRIDKLN